MTGKLFNEIQSEVEHLLSDLIRIDTSNPPGNEMEAARYLAEILGEEGLDCEIFESAPRRGNLISRMKGSGKKPGLLLLSHIDVVPANREGWTVDPFEGTIKEGYVWGRGALDMKGMTAIEVMTMKLLKRNRVKLEGDLILAATADEEKGGKFGVDYLLRNHPEKIRAPYVLNEGGGGGVALATPKGNVFVIQAAEKGLLWIKIKVRGTSGHGSVPDSADNAILHMNRIIKKLGEYRFQPQLTQISTAFIQRLAEADASLEGPLRQLLAKPESYNQTLREVEAIAPNMATELRPRMKNTITPTIISGGVKENIIPSECEAVFDCRILPGQTTDQMLDLMKDLLQDLDPEKITFEVIHAQEPSESPVDTLLFETITKVLRYFDPKCRVTPILMTGGTDSRFFRSMGSVCYGFQPRLAEMQYNKFFTREHGVDERISVRDLVFGTSVLYETVKRFLG
jgi:acetylornithine deacetylase/succinyl-diaminopimelate desuccinylase-like protein